MFDKRAAVSCKCLSLVAEVVVLLCYPRPSLAGIGVPWLVFSCGRVSWTWSERCVVVHILSDVGTENTYIPSQSNLPPVPRVNAVHAVGCSLKKSVEGTTRACKKTVR